MSRVDETVGTRADRARQVVAWSLRVFGAIDLLALVAFWMPTSWIRSGHEWCGLGSFPEGSIPEYLARATSLLWAMHGGLLLYLARDVRRYADLIRFVAKVTVLAGVCLFNLGLKTDLPLWWILSEGPVFSLSGLWYLWWLRQARIRGTSRAEEINTFPE